MLHLKQRLSAPFKDIQPLKKKVSQPIFAGWHLHFNEWNNSSFNKLNMKNPSQVNFLQLNNCILCSFIPKNVSLELLSVQNASPRFLSSLFSPPPPAKGIRFFIQRSTPQCICKVTPLTLLGQTFYFHSHPECMNFSKLTSE